MKRVVLAILAAGLVHTPAAATTALYRCALNLDVVANYASDAKNVTIYAQGQTFHLPVALSGSGAKYSDGKTTLWEHQGEALFETPGASFTVCKALRLGP
jgi:membrane-bound inhibitor of C-type lysozyme